MLSLTQIDKERIQMPYQDAIEIILLAEDDEVLDFEKSVKFFTEPTHFVQRFESGGHRFDRREDLVRALLKVL